MRKIFRALDVGACEKQFIGDHAVVPKGWYESPREALAAYEAPKAAPDGPEKRGPGRPPKSAA